MSYTETNIFPNPDTSDLTGRYDTYRVRNLRRDQDEYFQNREALVHDLSFKLQVPVQLVERQDEAFLVVRDDAKNVPANLPLCQDFRLSG